MRLCWARQWHPLAALRSRPYLQAVREACGCGPRPHSSGQPVSLKFSQVHLGTLGTRNPTQKMGWGSQRDYQRPLGLMASERFLDRFLQSLSPVVCEVTLGLKDLLRTGLSSKQPQL